MKIGILGAGHMGQVLARLVLHAGHSVVLANSRGPESLTELTTSLGRRASAARTEDLKRLSKIIVLAVRWSQLPEAVRALGNAGGQIVIDATNNRFGPGPEDVYDVGGRPSSEIVSTLLPGTHLVKAFNNQPIIALASLLELRGPRKALFLAGDHDSAKAVVARLIRDMGAEPLDAGSLRCGGRLMATGTGPLAGLGRLLTVPEAGRLLDRARSLAGGDCADPPPPHRRPDQVA